MPLPAGSGNFGIRVQLQDVGKRQYTLAHDFEEAEILCIEQSVLDMIAEVGPAYRGTAAKSQLTL